jgi:hypothetical protein
VTIYRVLSCRGSHIFIDSRLTDGGEVASLTRQWLFVPQNNFLLFISVKGCVHPNTIAGLEELGRLKNVSMTRNKMQGTRVTIVYESQAHSIYGHNFVPLDDGLRGMKHVVTVTRDKKIVALDGITMNVIFLLRHSPLSLFRYYLTYIKLIDLPGLLYEYIFDACRLVDSKLAR